VNYSNAKKNPNKKEVKLPVFVDSMILYVENPNGTIKKKSASRFNKVARYNINTQKSITLFLYILK
jgi:hypothetical protein